MYLKVVLLCIQCTELTVEFTYSDSPVILESVEIETLSLASIRYARCIEEHSLVLRWGAEELDNLHVIFGEEHLQ